MMSTSTQQPDATTDAYDRFEAWLHENGAYFEQLELREYDNPDSLQDDGNIDVSDNTSSCEEKKESTTYDQSNVSKTASRRHAVLNDDSVNENISEMRGVYCKSTIPPNSVCMAIPRKCLITVEMGQETEIGRQILSADLDLDAPKHIFLMIYILYDRLNPTSFFRPYYDILPKTLSNMPIFWSDEDLKYLEGSYLLHQIADRIEAIEEDYRAICGVCPLLASIATLDEFKWARMCVCSRNFGLQIDGNRTSAMVPHADMLNHYRPRETKWTFDDERQAFTITTLQTIQAGSQIFDSYGQKCNHRFLLNYGFAVEHNIELDGFCPNEVPLELSLLDDDPLFHQKLEFWCREESPAQKRIRVCVSNNENTKMLFSMLRVVVADEKEFELLNSAGTTASALRSSSSLCMALVYRTCRDVRFPLSLKNEKAALTHLLGLVRRALSLYSTTLAQDNENLAGDGLLPFSNARHAVIQVRGEKEVLHYYEDLAITALQVIDLQSDEEVDAAIKSMEGMGKHYLIVRYCADVIGSTRRKEQKKRSLARGAALYPGTL